MTTASTNMLQLPMAVGLTGRESLWVVQGGTDKRCTASQVAALGGGGGGNAQPVIITDDGEYDVPLGTLQLIIAKTDSANVVLPLIADQAEVGAIRIVGTTATAHAFNVLTSDGTIMGSLSAFPFSNDYQSATFYPVVALSTWTVDQQ